MLSCTGAASLRGLSYFSACFLSMTLLRHFLPRSLLNAIISSSLGCPGAITRRISIMALCRFSSRCHSESGTILRPLQAFQDAWPRRMARQQKNYSGLHLALAQDPINVYSDQPERNL